MHKFFVFAGLLIATNAMAQTNALNPTGLAGVGTTTPTVRLHVIDNASGWASIITNTMNDATVYMAHGGGYGMNVEAGSNASASTYGFYVHKGDDPFLYVSGDGKVGIGTISNSRNSEMLGIYGNTNGDFFPSVYYNASTGSSARIRQSFDNGSNFTELSFNGNAYSSVPNRFAFYNSSNNGDFLFLNNAHPTVSLGTGGSNNSNFYGRVGIGATSPVYALDVHDTLATLSLDGRASGNSGARINLLGWNSDEVNWSLATGILDNGNGLHFTPSTTAGGSTFTTPTMTILGTGEVKIGTNAAPGQLSVNGPVKTKKLIVTQTGWSDYVFNKAYKLRSLSSLEQFILQNKHLPDVPSAKDVEEKGINVGDNQALLLKKIEELTLYIISQQKQINDLSKEIAILKTNK